MISSIVLKDAEYIFWKDQLIKVSSSDIKDENKVLQLSKSLEKQLGKPDWMNAVKDEHNYSWHTGQEDITLSYYKFKELGGWISLISHQVANKKFETDRQTDKASGLLCDYKDFSKECYDVSTVKSLSGNIVRVTTILVDETQEYHVKLNKIVNINCLEGTRKTLYSAFYINGRLKNEKDETDDWAIIRKNTYLHNLRDSLCNK